MPITVNVTVMFVESAKAIDAEAMSRAAIKPTLGTRLVLNSKPAGARRTRLTLAPALKSNLLPSLIVIDPKVVQPGNAASAAVSAEILLPPEAGVIDEAANVRMHSSVIRDAARIKRAGVARLRVFLPSPRGRFNAKYWRK